MASAQSAIKTSAVSLLLKFNNSVSNSSCRHIYNCTLNCRSTPRHFGFIPSQIHTDTRNRTYGYGLKRFSTLAVKCNGQDQYAIASVNHDTKVKNINMRSTSTILKMIWFRSISSSPHQLNLSRSIYAHSLANKKNKCYLLAPPDVLFGCSHQLQARAVHSKSGGDEQFIEFLTKEITNEKEEPAELPSISGFDTVETKGPHVKLVKKFNNELITVRFTVNNSISSSEEDPEEEPSDEMDTAIPQMVSRPEFDVVIKKDGISPQLHLKCQLMDSSMDAEIKDEEDSFEILEFAMVDEEWNNDTYFVNADLLDPTMYDMLMLMLEERGINHSTFCEQLMQFSTGYEQDLYVNLLESLKKFIQK
ncbi:C1QBP [Bugula neritina]|uniref:C1QBP n=1 Tax=Bugula neritina TaxID=10212 RepID=A0A7J7JBL8_BUGNE|nr:C1QBP [Bugula neritina]